MLNIKNLTKRYKNTAVNAVENLNISLKEGEIFGFLGMNGAGKSTTIKCLTGIYPFDKGQITICNKDIVKDSIQAKLNIGYVPDNHSVYEKFTGKEYVNYVADLYRVNEKDRTQRLFRYAKMFRLTDDLENQIKSYSHGMKQKICVIAALIHSPKLWVLDEPMMGLDPQSTVQIIRLMKEHCKKGNTVFFSSHNLDMVAKICDRAAIIEKGKLHSIIDLHEEGKKENLENTFLQITAFEESYE
ncbi:MAG: ABC transporter ATP-binding protein [Bacillota bacterium]